MWQIIIATITGTGIGLSVHIFYHWYKHYKSNQKLKQQKHIESIVIVFLKQLQTDEQDGNITRSETQSKKS